MEVSRKRRTGVVVSNKMDKTVVILTDRTTRHPLYRKYLKKHVKFKAHDEGNACQIGDMVLVEETRPLSRDKRWRVVEVVRKAI
ncbi:MAG: 30S ribosomal protein S17 [Deltaproteobacteria bacterium]|nr:30S ribosomal protein S17 [Deltaproteobacteria bacterium]